MRKTLIVLATLVAILGFLMVPGGAVEPASADHSNCFQYGCAPVWPVPHFCIVYPHPPHEVCLT